MPEYGDESEESSMVSDGFYNIAYTLGNLELSEVDSVRSVLRDAK